MQSVSGRMRSDVFDETFFLGLDDPRLKSEVRVPEYNNERPHSSSNISLLRAYAITPTVTRARLRKPAGSS
ncbi:hypothetical protein JWS04_07290 [Bradyrhizobium vignae]|uniref:Integrase catalytic domain-containing protein n=2 Tax=Bradyrhizobium vignae TaxID=1549949 RepID=A0ABS3ZSZ8_9BRAD|nr:hypothetical protein [Bradyrhizobium vignae]